MKPELLCRIRRFCAACALSALAGAPTTGHTDTVASVLGNFTVNQYCGVELNAYEVVVHYTVLFGQLPALRELHLADADGDGVTTPAERNAYVARLAPTFADQVALVLDDAPIPLRAAYWTTSVSSEPGGAFSLRLDVDLWSALPASTANGFHTLRLTNQNFPNAFGWQEIVVDAAPPIGVFATDAFSTSLTSGLQEVVPVMPATGPLHERAVHLSFTRGTVPAGAQPLQPRPGTVSAASPAATQASGGTSGAWLQGETRELIRLISTPNVAPHIAMLALLAAALLGALHAFSPGHGKTVVGAYLIGAHATPRHALFLGVTVTITHTLGVFALGFATLLASQHVAAERLFPILSLVSGLLVLGMGIVLLAQRWRAAREVLKQGPGQSRQTKATLGPTMAFRPIAQGAELGGSLHEIPMALTGGRHRHTHERPKHHADGHPHHEHEHDADHVHDISHVHYHGSRIHSHLPPGAAGEEVTWRSLLALGVSGGLVPCPSAMVLLLAAVAINKTAYGLMLVVAFSVGLAATLTAVGLAFSLRAETPLTAQQQRPLATVATGGKRWSDHTRGHPAVLWRRNRRPILASSRTLHPATVGCTAPATDCGR